MSEIDGAKLFKARCAQCHTCGEDEPHKVGVNLHGLFGRKSGSVSSYNRYSDAMKHTALTWDSDTLFDYLESPKKFIPGSKMSFAGLKNQEYRRSLITYLEKATS